MQVETQLSLTQQNFVNRFEQLQTLLVNVSKKKDSSNLILLTNITKELYFLIEKENFNLILQKENTSFSESISKRINNQPSIVQNPKTEQEISIYIMLGLFLYRNKEYQEAQGIFWQVIFERPWLFSQRSYLNHLSDYLFYKYLNCIEFQGNFNQEKNQLYSQLKNFEIAKKELLYSNLYIFMMRNFLQTNNYSELSQFLQNCIFPEQIQFVNYTKYLFYKGLYFGKVGDYKNSYKFIGEAMRKAPSQNLSKKQTGLRNYFLTLKKHFVILELLMNELPQPTMFENEPELDEYKTLVRMVSNGLKQQFEQFVKKQERKFKSDGVWHLLSAMKQIVLRNALKKLSIAYTKISEQDLCQKIGVQGSDNFELKSFLMKSRKFLENFQIDAKNGIINFEKTEEDYSTKRIRETFMQRMLHLNSLDDQVKKSLKFPDKKKEVKQENSNEDDFLDDLDFGDSMISDDYFQLIIKNQIIKIRVLILTHQIMLLITTNFLKHIHQLFIYNLFYINNKHRD